MAATLGSRKGRGSSASSAAKHPPREAVPGDNLSQAEKERQKFEADSVQLLSGLSTLKPMITQAELDAATAKASRDAVTNFKKKLSGSLDVAVEEINQILDDQKQDRRTVTHREVRRARVRRMAGQPVAESETQPELDERLPEGERDIFHWRGAGYAAGLNLEERRAPPACEQHADTRQAWLESYDKGMKERADAFKSVETRAAEAAEAAKPPAPEETEVARRRREKAEEKAAKDALAKLGSAALEAEGDKIIAGGDQVAENGDQVAPDDNFEATPEELAAQVARRESDALKARDDSAANDGEAL